MDPLAAALELAGAEPTRILDLGTGTGAAALWLAERYPEARVTGVDVADEMIGLARGDVAPGDEERVGFEIADAADLRFETGAFDLVVQVSAPAFFAETARVLAPGGSLVIVSSRGTGTPVPHAGPAPAPRVRARGARVGGRGRRGDRHLLRVSEAGPDG